jgi:hypothetical protein
MYVAAFRDSLSRGDPYSVRQWLEVSFLYNFPIILLIGATPLLLIRSRLKVYLSRDAVSVPTAKLSLEQMIQFTAGVACLVFFCRVPMHVLKLTFQQILVFLPGMALLCSIAALIVVVPSMRWVFKRQSTWHHWALFGLASIAGVCILSTFFSLLLGSWSRGLGISGLMSYVILITAMMTTYFPGMIALRWSGFRWTSGKSADASATQMTQQLDGDLGTRRWWTGIVVALAVLTQVPSKKQRLPSRISCKSSNVRWSGTVGSY